METTAKTFFTVILDFIDPQWAAAYIKESGNDIMHSIQRDFLHIPELRGKRIKNNRILLSELQDPKSHPGQSASNHQEHFVGSIRSSLKNRVENLVRELLPKFDILMRKPTFCLSKLAKAIFNPETSQYSYSEESRQKAISSNIDYALYLDQADFIVFLSKDSASLSYATKLKGTCPQLIIVDLTIYDRKPHALQRSNIPKAA